LQKNARGILEIGGNSFKLRVIGVKDCSKSSESFGMRRSIAYVHY